MSNVFDDLSYAYIEYYVGMAKMVAYWHVKALGFELEGYRGPETGIEDELSFLLRKGRIRLVITSAAKPSSFEILSFVDRHGNGVKRLGYRVPNVEEAFKTAISRGAIPMSPPTRLEDEHGYVEEAAIKVFDRKEITFFDNSQYKGCFRPGFRPHAIRGFQPDFDNGFQDVDHIAFGMHVNEMNYWCDNYFLQIFGGSVQQDIGPGDVITKHSGLVLRLTNTKNDRLHNVFVEPLNRSRQSQVQEYLEAYYGSGVQHLAFRTDNIFGTVKEMRENGVDFVKYPKSYYDIMRREERAPADLIDKLEAHNLLCDGDDGSYLFQTFTKPFGDRPTFFYEVIQRTGDYRGFALDNITQLFRAVESEQSKRVEASNG